MAHNTAMIPYGCQDITDADVEAVEAVLKSDFLTQGPEVAAFEAALCAHTDASRAVAVNSATSALHIACLALDLGLGDVLWTSPITFVASANCARLCGADVDFVDIDRDTLNMSAERLEEKLTRVKRESGRLPKVVVPVHLCGLSCDMAAIGDLAKTYGFRVIEDASHAIGGRYQGLPVGACLHSDITVFSFHPVKIVTTAEGGAALTNNPVLAARMERLRSHGVTRDAALMTCQSEGPWFYQQTELGLNYRMTDIHAALGRSQLTRLEAYVVRRNALADRYDSAFETCALRHQARPDWADSAFHLYVIRIAEAERRRVIFEALRAMGIGVNVHYIPVHLQPYYRDLGFRPGDYPEAEQYYDGAISLPLFPTMTEEQQDRVIAAVRQLLAT